jgi:ATP-dependent DNA helicase RecG
MGLVRDIDLVLHLPLRYEDATRITPVAHLQEGVAAQCELQVQQSEVELKPRRQLVVHTRDDAGAVLVLRFVHFYPTHQKTLKEGQRIRVMGEARQGYHGVEMIHPQFQAIEANQPLPCHYTPVYPASQGLPQTYLRKAVNSALQKVNLEEVLPAPLLPAHWPSLRNSLETLHHPSPDIPLHSLQERTHPAWQRLKFDELLAQQLSQLQARAQRAAQCAPPFPLGLAGLGEALQQQLPFSLTGAQQRVVHEITQDLARPTPMHRLLQGDVGAGKTVVAALAAAVAMQEGWQVALMAPTEILAEQHFRKLVAWLQPLNIQVAWLSGSRKGKTRLQMLELIAQGKAALVVGTHAVIQNDVNFQRLGLAIIDEQHRFGVVQRLALRQKSLAQMEPHLLMMSATPIPRTLAMTVFADLDISTLDELPPGRTPVATRVFSDQRRSSVIDILRQELGPPGQTPPARQVYWVCPLIEESEKLDLQNATATHEELCAALPGHAVGLLHGRMPAAGKAAVMDAFSRGEMAVLVSTTVIEVGVDVPHASLMVIEHAERFGLSQLHQLRGRVGRGSVASVCVLLYTAPLSDTGKARLKAMAQTNDGFEIARLDLEIRGPGEFLGERQSGTDLLRFADLQEDTALLDKARKCALQMAQSYPVAAEKHLARWSGVKAEFLKA